MNAVSRWTSNLRKYAILQLDWFNYGHDGDPEYWLPLAFTLTMLHRRFRNYSKLIARFIRFDSSSKPPVQGYSESNQKLAGGKLREGYCSTYLAVESRIARTGTFQLKCKFSPRRDSANDRFSVSSIKSLTSLIDLLKILKGAKTLLHSTIEPLFNRI